MLRIFLMFAVLFASVCLGIFLQHDAGYLLIHVHHWTLETTLWVALPVLLLSFLCLHTFLIFWEKMLTLPQRWHEWIQQRRARKAQAITRRGLIEFSEGHWLSAKKHLTQALPNADTPLLNYLTAARAAQELGDYQLRDHYLREAQQSMPEATVAVELTQAQLQLANQQWEQALATLRHLQDLAPQHPYVLKLLMQLYEEIHDWQQLIVLLPALKHQRILSNVAYQQLQQRAYLNTMLDLIRQNRTESLHEFMQHIPKELNHHPALIAEYCQYLLERHYDQHPIEGWLRRALQKEPQPKLLALYSRLSNEVGQLTFIESLLKKQTHLAALYLCLGRMCVSQQLWGKARSYFEEGIKFEPSPELYAEYGQLLEQHFHDFNGACKIYHEGLCMKVKVECNI